MASECSTNEASGDLARLVSPRREDDDAPPAKKSPMRLVPTEVVARVLDGLSASEFTRCAAACRAFRRALRCKSRLAVTRATKIADPEAAALNCPARFPSLTVVFVEAADEQSLRFATALLLSPLAQRWREFRLRIHVDDVAESADVVKLFGEFFHATQTEWGSNARLEEFTVEFVDLLGDVLSPYESDQFYELGFHDVLYTFRDSNNRALYDRPTSMEFEDVLDEIVLRRLPPRVGLRLAVLWGAPFYSIQNLLLSGYESGTNLGVNEAGAHSDPLAYYVARSSGSLTARVEVLELLMTKGMSLNVLSLRTHRSALSELIAGGGVGSGDAGKLVFAKSLVNHGASASGGSPSPLLTTCGAGLDRGDFSNYRREPPNGHTAHLIFYLLTRGGASPFARFDSSTAAEYLRLWQKDAQLTLNANTSNLISAYKMYGTPMTSGMRYYQESIDKYKRALHGMDAMMKVLLCALDDVHRTEAFPADPRDDTYDRWLRGKGRAT